MKSKDEVLLVSACLAGDNCKYSGGNNLVPSIRELAESGHVVCVCPEVLGGLPTPRLPSEIQRDGRVLNRAGQDVTEAYRRGGEEAVRLAKLTGCRWAILKERSPACSCDRIYDGSFSGVLREGRGSAAEALEQAGVTVLGESMLHELPEE